MEKRVTVVGRRSTIQVAGLFSMELLLRLQVDLWPLELDHQVVSCAGTPTPLTVLPAWAAWALEPRGGGGEPNPSQTRMAGAPSSVTVPELLAPTGPHSGCRLVSLTAGGIRLPEVK